MKMMPCSKSNRRKIIVIVTFSILIAVFIVITTQNIANSDNVDDAHSQEYYTDAFGDFLIDGENCKIPNLSPFSANAMKVFKRLKYEKCYGHDPLTLVQRDESGINRLIINESEIKNHLVWFMNEITCCYQRITRSGQHSEADNNFKLSRCISFESGHVLKWWEDEFILVTCKGFIDIFAIRRLQKEIYVNAHALVIPKNRVLVKQKRKTSLKGPNVLLIGIDSISRLNFIRSMPETFEFVSKGGWYDMKAFNKIGDNTFPNLNALLNGRNLSKMEEDCNWKKEGELEKCRFLWNEFNDAGYATAYAEDTSSIQTFNYYKTGFVHQPTDHYLRPFTLAAEKHIRAVFSSRLVKCLGYHYYADFIYQYARDFANAYKNESFFGLFWTNSFSHDDLNLPSEYDIRMKFYLEEIQSLGILNNTIVIFFSDHGIRFGEIRKYYTGWLEERLPYLFFWLPESFKKEYPALSENLRINQERLVTPYDVYITVKHILQLSGGYHHNLTAISCSNCQSLFHEVPSNRSCVDAAISSYWCSCTAFSEVDKSSLNVEKVVRFALQKLNSDLKVLKECAQLRLKEVSSARESVHGANRDYLISFEVHPSNGQMEATVRCNDPECEDELQVIGEISRINRYGDQSNCINDAYLRKYCYCT